MLSRVAAIRNKTCDIVIGLGGQCQCFKDPQNLNDYLTNIEAMQKYLIDITGTPDLNADSKKEEVVVEDEKKNKRIRRRSYSPPPPPREEKKRSRSPPRARKDKTAPGDETKTIYVRYVGKDLPGPFDTLERKKTEGWRLGSQVFSRYGVVIACYVWEYFDRVEKRHYPIASVTYKTVSDRDYALKNTETIETTWNLRISPNKFDE